MRKALIAIFLIIAFLLNATFLELQPAEAISCSVTIVNISPQSGTSFEHNTLIVNVNITVSWSLSQPNNLTGATVYLDKAFWNETKNGWQYYVGTIMEHWDSNQNTPTPPKTLRLGFEPGRTYLLNASISCTYVKSVLPGGIPEIGYSEDFDQIIVDYPFKSASSLQASFTMNPENPTVNDTITFASTSMSPNGTITENKWYLDGQYLQNVGNSASWSSKLQAGTHTVKLTVTDSRNYSDTATKIFEVKDASLKQLTLTASTSKATYITHEKIVISGKLTYDNSPVISADIKLKIQQADGTTNTWPGPITAADGTYKIEYEIPKTPFKSTPPSPETWNIEVAATPVETGYNTAPTIISLQIVPVFLQLHNINLVQVTEAPTIDGKKYLAAGKEAGLRAMISCPSLKGITDASKPNVTVQLDISSGGSNIRKESNTVTIGEDPTPADFVFQLDPGTYLIGARVDPNYDYMNLDSTQALWDSLSATSKIMKDLSLKYLPVELDFSSVETLSNFRDFCTAQDKLIKDTYPLSPSNYKSNIMNVVYSNTFTTTRLGYLFDLSLKYFLEKTKIVGVLPDADEWWDRSPQRNETGFASARTFPGAVLVRNNCVPYSAAHEIGHTLGLNLGWVGFSREEYVNYPSYGKQVEGLILKDGKIYDLSRTETIRGQKRYPEVEAAFGRKYAVCFMGYNPGGESYASWICKETYQELFRNLMDPPTEKVLYVAGTIESDTVKMNKWYLGEGLPDNISEGNYTIQSLSSSGEILFSTTFGIDTEQSTPFGFIISFPNYASKVVISQYGKVLQEVYKTPNSPTVNLLSPKVEESVGRMCEVKWNAEDQDGDQLYYSVLLSQDAGETWTALAIERQEKQCVLDLSTLPTGTQCLVKVVATDGLNTGEDVSDGFFIAGSNNLPSPSETEIGNKYSINTNLLVTIIIIAALAVVAIALFLVFKKRKQTAVPNGLQT